MPRAINIRKFLFITILTIYMIGAPFFSGCILRPDVLAPISDLPRIESAQTIKYINDRDIATSSFRIGDKVNFIVVASDSNEDIDTIYIKGFAPKSTYREPTLELEFVDLKKQTKKIASFSLPEPIEIDGSPGKWRIDVQVKDKKNNMSNVYTLYVIAHKCLCDQEMKK